MSKEEDRIKRELKLKKDKKHKKIPRKVQELLNATFIMEETYYGFPLKLYQLKEKNAKDKYMFRVYSPFFKKGVAAIARQSESSALWQGRYLVYALINYDDERENILSEEGWEFINNNKIECPYPKKI